MSKTVDLRKRRQGNTATNPLYVNVVNQIDLSLIESLLNQIKDFAQNITENTDELELKLDTINDSISNGFALNHSDLIDVINYLNQLESNTDDLENQLTQIILGITGINKYADNTSQSTIAVSTSDILIKAANPLRKQLYVINHSTKIAWISRNSPAIVGQGIPLAKDEIYIEDIYRGAFHGIWETGASGTFTVIEDIT